jgi:hypothetical protein
MFKQEEEEKKRQEIVWFTSVQKGQLYMSNFNEYLMPQSPFDTMSYILNPNLGSIEHRVPAVW